MRVNGLSEGVGNANDQKKNVLIVGGALTGKAGVLRDVARLTSFTKRVMVLVTEGQLGKSIGNARAMPTTYLAKCTRKRLLCRKL